MMFIVFNSVNRELRTRWTSQLIVSARGPSLGQAYSPSDRVRSGDGANIMVDNGGAFRIAASGQSDPIAGSCIHLRRKTTVHTI